MGTLYGTIAALLFGADQWTSLRAGKAATSRQVVATAVLAAAVVLTVLAPVLPGHWDNRSIGIGVLSGIGVAFGQALLIHAFSVAPMGVSAPATSVVSASVPVAWGLVRGDPLSGLAIAGVITGLVAVVLVSWFPSGASGSGSRKTGLMIGTLSGLSFGAGFTVMSYADDNSGVWPVASQRVAAAVLVIGLAVATRQRPFVAGGGSVRPHPRTMAAISGVCGGVGVVSLLAGYRTGSLGPTAIASSQGAAVGVLLAALLDHQRLRWWQFIGLALAGCGVAMLSVS